MYDFCKMNVYRMFVILSISNTFRWISHEINARVDVSGVPGTTAIDWYSNSIQRFQVSIPGMSLLPSPVIYFGA